DPGVLLLDRLGPDLHAVGDQQRFETGVRKRGDGGGEVAHLLRGDIRQRVGLGGVGDRSAEAPGEVLPLREDRLDIPSLRLRSEERVGNGYRLGGREECPEEEEVEKQQEEDGEPCTPWRHTVRR